MWFIVALLSCPSIPIILLLMIYFIKQRKNNKMIRASIPMIFEYMKAVETEQPKETCLKIKAKYWDNDNFAEFVKYYDSVVKILNSNKARKNKIEGVEDSGGS